MKYLIDTHILIWFIEGNNKLPVEIRNVLTMERNKIQVSTLSLWEISIKTTIGKLKLKQDISKIFSKCEEYWNIKNGFSKEELQNYENLPLHHRDPFDRMLIALAKTEKLTIITKDQNFSKYDVDILW